ncbi:ABC transporter substrate-binding protein [Nocardia goodfellowii]
MVPSDSGFVWASILDTLLYLDNRGNVQPNAAESWEYSSDRRTLTLKLRSGMTFSTGAPVNAAAVKATIDRTTASKGLAAARIKSVREVRTPDERTVVLDLAHPDPGLLEALTKGSGAIGDPATLSQPRTTLDPVGSGPYILNTAETVNGSIYVLNRRDDYWNVEQYPFRTVKVRIIQDRTATVNALQAGELNAGSVEASHLDRLRAVGFKDQPALANSMTLTLVDRAGEVVPALADPRVRRAINMAFDRAKMTQQLIKGAGRPTVQSFNPKGMGYDAALESTYQFEVEGAKKLLAEAGYPNGFSLTMPELFYSKSFGPTVAQSLASIGITVQWEPVPPLQTDQALASRKYGAFLMIEGLAGFPEETARYRTSEPGRNPFASQDPELDALLAQYDQEGDPARSADLAKKISAFLVRNAWDAPLFFIERHWVTKDGITFLGDGSNTFTNVRQFGLSG